MKIWRLWGGNSCHATAGGPWQPSVLKAHGGAGYTCVIIGVIIGFLQSACARAAPALQVSCTGMHQRTTAASEPTANNNRRCDRGHDSTRDSTQVSVVPCNDPHRSCTKKHAQHADISKWAQEVLPEKLQRTRLRIMVLALFRAADTRGGHCDTRQREAARGSFASMAR